MIHTLWIRFLNGADIDALAITPAEVITAVENVVAAHGRGETVFEPRTHLVPNNGGTGHFNVLRGHVDTLGERGLSGVKVVGDFVPNYQKGLPSELALMNVYDPATGVPLSIMDATWITEVRTGAMTAVGAKHLARPGSRILGHVGARGTAFANVTMLDSLFPLEEIRVTSRRPESREAFADRLREATGTPVRVVATADEAFDGADILVEASRLEEPAPLLRTAAVKPGAFVVPYGTVSAVELDLLDVMDKVVVDDWRESQSGRFGALRAHVDTGRLSEQTLYAQIGEIVSGRKPGRERPDERILFWHRGLSILDVALAHLVLTRAEAADAGTMLRDR
ncbi:ornithine cyclodeaminase family protein [Paractinoplanes brasiliensis]|uniref:Ornithine cyclodeaminase n=1 Tax=Paractinoplanes brasiliensis TaxID=52695 RepID=A0A4R6JA86_9ACTN|nr:ornithine cyclodeaminase family protein [Actinoplanes brasiliensis]TDO32580.1 ornithine cyclodeaminase [Actinoplanes brasiliensis]GID27541.1 ornithine cyclodeaminase [Actinoplanes brasiliensis]